MQICDSFHGNAVVARFIHYKWWWFQKTTIDKLSSNKHSRCDELGTVEKAWPSFSCFKSCIHLECRSLIPPEYSVLCSHSHCIFTGTSLNVHSKKQQYFFDINWMLRKLSEDFNLRNFLLNEGVTEWLGGWVMSDEWRTG